MLRIVVVMLMMLMAFAKTASSQTIEPKSLSNSFSKIPGTPRVAANEAEKEWLVVWRQNTPGKILGRIVQSNGTPGPRKTLLKGVDSSGDSLDVAFDSLNSRYLLAFESARGLEVQLFEKNLSKRGSSVLIERGVQESHVRVVFDSKANQYLLFWLGIQDGATRILNSLLLDLSGNAINSPRIVAKSGQGNHFGSLSVARNQKKGSFMVMMVELTPSGENSVIGYMVKPDGSSIGTKASVFQGFEPGATLPQASFTDSGSGLGFWSHANQLKSRKISDTGKAGPSTNTVITAIVPINPQPAIAFDSKNGEFIALWAEGKEIKGARLNANTGTATEEFDVSSSILDHTPHIALSYNEGSENFLAVWEDAAVDANANPTAFRIRGGVLGGTQGAVINTTEIFTFDPANVTVHVGDTVTWINSKSTLVHTVTSGEPSSAGLLFDRILGRKGSFQFKFNQSGSFPYFCRIHGVSMKGVIKVVP